LFLFVNQGEYIASNILVSSFIPCDHEHICLFVQAHRWQQTQNRASARISGRLRPIIEQPLKSFCEKTAEESTPFSPLTQEMKCSAPACQKLYTF